jgi:hypothetical protein
MTTVEYPTIEVTREEYIALVTSNRPLIRVSRELEGVRELLDRETQERFRILESELFPGSGRRF